MQRLGKSSHFWLTYVGAMIILVLATAVVSAGALGFPQLAFPLVASIILVSLGLSVMTRILYQSEKEGLTPNGQMGQESLSPQNSAGAVPATQLPTDVIAHMGHELRTPLNGVLGMAGLLKESSLTKDQMNFVRAIEDSGESLLMTLNHIFDYSRLSQEGFELEPDDFNLVQLVESVVEIFAPTARAKDIELSVCMAAIEPWAYGDAGRLRQVLWHLVSNAVKFTHAGAVLVEVKRVARGEQEGWIAFHVTDTGVGIDANQQEGMFEAFSELSMNSAERYGGLGLGLAVCDQLVQAMGGMLRVCSMAGEGSHFSFSVPLESAHMRHAQHTLTEDAERLQGVKVLVADDHNFNRHIFQRQLEDWQMQVTVVNDGAAAVEEIVRASAHNEPYQLGIIDHVMPGMTGEEVAAYLQHDESLQETKLILASSKGVGAADYAGLREKGFVHTLVKPVRKETLQKALLTALHDADAGQENVHVRSATNGQRGLRVLVVDDDLINQQVTCHYLRQQVPLVEVASNGLEAVASANQLAYDLILMDITMPEMDGIEATIAIRQGTGASKHSKIMALTAHTDLNEAKYYQQIGMDAVLAKPISKEVVQDILTQLRHDNDKPAVLSSSLA